MKIVGLTSTIVELMTRLRVAIVATASTAEEETGAGHQSADANECIQSY